MANIYRYVNGAFKQVTGKLKTIAAGEAGQVWGVNDAGKVYRFNPATASFGLVPTSVAFKHIAVGSGVWGIDVSGNPYHWDGAKFVKAGGKVAYIGVPLRTGDPWARWGASILRYDAASNAFVLVANSYSFLGVGNRDSHVWAVHNDGTPWLWNGQKFVKNADEALRLTSVSPGLYDVFGISLSGRTYRTALQTGPNPPHFEGGLIPGWLVRIDTGAVDVSGMGMSAEIDCAWGMNEQGQVYQYDGKWKARGGPYTVLAVGVGSLKQGLAGDGKTSVWNEEPNVWALG